MLPIAQYVLLGLVLVAFLAVPPSKDCAAETAFEQAQSQVCPPGKDGQSLPGIQGPPGRDCTLMWLPNNRFGCRYDDGSLSEYEETILPEFQAISPQRFWWVIGTVAAVVGAASWKIM